MYLDGSMMKQGIEDEMNTLYLCMPTRTITICTGSTLKAHEIMKAYAKDYPVKDSWYVIRSNANGAAIWRS